MSLLEVIDLSSDDENEPGANVSAECFAPQCRQFWKAGDYEVGKASKASSQDGNNYLRVHPKFLHSNATSHKWAFGAIAELLDNAVDEIQNGATYVIVDTMKNPRDGSPTLLIQDDGGGMDPETLRRCMSFGFSDKQSDAAIGQYGNGFKTSTMRLGADVIVFSRSMHGGTSTQSTGLLSYTFLQKTLSDDIRVPIFDNIGHHGTKIIIYNLWFNDDGEMELNFESDSSDIMISGAQKIVEKGLMSNMMTKMHIANLLRYSLRVYSSILYLHIPNRFHIILRGKVVEPRHLARDLKYVECIKYQPQGMEITEGTCIVTIGFLNGSPDVNIHGFNIYHKNRLILPFWRVVSKTNGTGRGVSGVVETNFIKPTHDKQDFEKSTLYHRLEGRLKQMTLEYWNYHCHLVGYAPKMVPRQSPHSGLHNSVEYASLGCVTFPSDLEKTVSRPSVSLSQQEAVTALDSRAHTIQSQFTNRITFHSRAAVPEKRSHGNRAAEVESSKKQAMDGVTAVASANNCITKRSVGVEQQKREIMIMTEKNKNLRAECSQYEKAEKELLLKVEQLRSEIREARQLRDRLLDDLNSLGKIKIEIK
ncbi:unnamed protein product [Spirodela intermedia]|uniref:Morc S5 domain-containing protein n=1 Tax=Spirodela intermedia TaxID=51605 RepID=A0A7I8IT92_SPIIN|nr:unnamed protein product [Spirodela intermedia]CAA6661224.1 unnamed protein product [Spirodela intermedia]